MRTMADTGRQVVADYEIHDGGDYAIHDVVLVINDPGAEGDPADQPGAILPPCCAVVPPDDVQHTATCRPPAMAGGVLEPRDPVYESLVRFPLLIPQGARQLQIGA
jgi:hypothetical protein